MTARTLRAQLMRASMLTTAAALLLSACGMLGYEYFSFRAEREKDLRAQAELLARAVAPALLFNDAHSAEFQLSSLKEKPGLRQAVVYDMAGGRFAIFRALTLQPSQSVPALQWDRPAVRHDGSLLEMVYPIEHDGERVGMLDLVAEHDLVARMGNYAAILGFVVLAGLALSRLVFGGLQRRITEPLLSVTQVARQVMNERDWRLRAQSDPSSEEIEVLVDSFNGMLAEVQAAQDQLLDADRKKDVFLATLAHELRNPLAPMANAVQLLQRETLPPGMRAKNHDILSRQLRHIVRLIDDLLDVSRITTGKLVLKNERLDLLHVVRASVELMEPVARGRGQQLQSQLSGAPAFVLGDSARLQQVFTNLLTNACRYTPDGGRIDVRLDVKGDDFCVAVTDTGIGIDPSLHEAVFELFEQADKRLERGNTGLGIGLTLARQLVMLHGGSLTLASEGVGRGSCFTVSLPRAGLPEDDEPTPPADEWRRPEPNGLAVLIADDNVDYADSMKAMLELAGHHVEVVADGQAALQKCLASRKDVAILDIGMPGLNGYEVARRLNDDPMRPSALVAVSGWGRAEDKANAQAAGFDHHFTKPLDLELLLPVLGVAKDTTNSASKDAITDENKNRLS